ncbi:Negative elongation factor B [Fasciola gigantica]|uniref:Negative elongation factor B n=1 Tax=Fasciola gigantica TaxID=46835 RepID=A0A504YXB6_FASGI|nr:Negative elongation factor B [Fasciola gigantica]
MLAERTAHQQASAAVAAAVTLKEPSSPPPPPSKRRRRLDSTGSTSSGRDRTTSESQSIPGPQAFIPLAFLPCQPALISATLCTLRFDILMSLNEAKVDRLCVPDRIHRLVWGLDACVRNRRIDPRHASGLAYHLTIQRQRAKRASDDASLNIEDQAADDDDDDDDIGRTDPRRSAQSAPGSARGKLGKTGASSSAKWSLSLHKKGETDTVAEDATSTKKETERELLEKDVHMACRDPWVIYTICTSLIRYTLNGLYEDKLPRDMPEVSLLVRFLLFGLGDDINPIPTPAILTRDRSGSSKRGSSPMPEEEVIYPKCPMKALIGHVLPAVAQLQVLTWRAQLAEEILATSHHLWPTIGSSITPTTTAAGDGSSPSAGATPRRSSLSNTSDLRECAQPPSTMQKQITDAAQSTCVTLPAGYLAHPIGYLILQYHALFALERNELTVLRVLLKTAAAAVQHQSRASRSVSKLTPSKTTSSPPPSSTNTQLSSFSASAASSSVCFRWRPEVLQALVLGISRLPSSSPAFVDASRASHRASGQDSSSLGDNRSQIDVVANSTENAPTEHNPATGPATGEHQGVTMSSGAGKSSSTAGHHHHTGPLSESRLIAVMPTITRTELAMLLRASLTLVNDLSLLALAQIAFLVPGPQPGTPTSSTVGCSTGSGMSSTVTTPVTPDAPVGDPLSPGLQLSDRERLINVLARHCASTGAGPSSGTGTGTATAAEPVESTPPTTIQVTGSNWAPICSGTVGTTMYKSSNSRVLSALELLRKDVERCTSSTPVSMIGGSFGSGTKTGLYVNYGPQTPFLSMTGGTTNPSRFGSLQMPSQPDTWAGATPRSPTSGRYTRSLSTGSASYSSASRLDSRGGGTSSSSSAYNPSPVLNAPLPMGTPLTNPGQVGLGGATPNLSNLIGMIPPTPRRPSTPPREFLPSSSAVTTSSSGLSNFTLSSHLGPAYGADLQPSCPSPSVHRTNTVGLRGAHPYSSAVRPHSPTLPDN